MELVNADDSGRVDISAEQAWARDLLDANRLYRQSARARLAGARRACSRISSQSCSTSLTARASSRQTNSRRCEPASKIAASCSRFASPAPTCARGSRPSFILERRHHDCSVPRGHASAAAVPTVVGRRAPRIGARRRRAAGPALQAGDRGARSRRVGRRREGLRRVGAAEGRARRRGALLAGVRAQQARPARRRAQGVGSAEEPAIRRAAGSATPRAGTRDSAGQRPDAAGRGRRQRRAEADGARRPDERRPRARLPLVKQMLQSASSAQGPRSRAVRARAERVARGAADAGRDRALGRESRLQARAIQNLGLFGGHESRQSLVDIYKTSQNMQRAQGRAAGRSWWPATARGSPKWRARRLRRSSRRKPSISSASRAVARSCGSSTSRKGRSRRSDAIINALFVGGGSERLASSRRRSRIPALRREAIEKLGLTGQQVAPTLKTIYGSEKDPEIKRAILNAFFVQGNATSAGRDREQEQDPRLKRDAIEKLSVMGSKEATDYIMELLK